MWQGERRTIPESIWITFLHWVLFFTKCLFWESLEIKFCLASTFLSCMSGPLSISQSTKSLCLFNKRKAERKNWSAVPENLDFIPSIPCLSSLSLWGIYLEGKQLHKEVKFFLPSPKQLGALESAISEISVSSLLSKMTSLSHRPAKHAAFCCIPVTARWWKAGRCLIGRLSKRKGDFQFERLIVRKGWKGEALGGYFSHKFIETSPMPPFIFRSFLSTIKHMYPLTESCKAVRLLLWNINV